MDGDTQRDEAVRLLNDFQDISFYQIALIIIGISLAIWIVGRFLPYLAERGPSQSRVWFLAATPVIRLGLMVLAILWIVPIVFIINFQNFLVIAGAASVAIGFAFKDYVSSIIAGIIVLFERPYRAGDWVEIDGDYGEIRDVGLRALKLVTPDDQLITVPHGRIWTDNVSNSSYGATTLQCVTTLYVAPEHDAFAVRAALKDVALTSAFLRYDRPVQIVLVEEPWGTHYKIRAYPFDLRDQFLFVSDLTIRGKEAIRTIGAVPASRPAAPGSDGTSPDYKPQ